MNFKEMLKNVGIVILYLVLGFLIGTAARSGFAERVQKEVTAISTEPSSDFLRTVEYDGHFYILYRGKDAGGIVHSPNCSFH